MNRIILNTFILFTCISCTEKLVGPDLEDTPINNFKMLWKDYDEHYSRFIYKGINWDSIYNVYMPLVNDNLTDEDFFNLLSRMISNLKDGHAIIESPDYFYAYPHKIYKENFNLDNIRHNYLLDVSTNEPFLYGKLSDRLGYIYISSFSKNRMNFNYINKIIKQYNKLDGIIIDIRNNGGGEESNAQTIASHFTEKKLVYKYNLYRNGPEHDDFSEKNESTFYPAEDNIFKGKIATLTNRYVGSAAEDFVLMMKQIHGATIIGDYTGGGAGGCPITRELPNGWIYRIPTCLQTDINNVPFEGIGIEPDLYLQFQTGDEEDGIDPILEKAIEILSQ